MISKLLNPAISSPCLSYAPSSVSEFEDSLGYLKATNVTAFSLNWSWLGSPSSRGFPSSNQLPEFIWSHPQHLFPSYPLYPICQQVHCSAFEILSWSISLHFTAIPLQATIFFHLVNNTDFLSSFPHRAFCPEWTEGEWYFFNANLISSLSLYPLPSHPS